MNFDQYNSNKQWNNINQGCNNTFPQDWDFEEENTDFNQNEFQNNFNKTGNCYYGTFYFCERPFSNKRPTNHKKCRCPRCCLNNLFRNFYC